MSTLPDLQTGNISYIAYWNAITQGGVGSIDVTQATSDSNIQQYTAYDNGVEGDYQFNNGRVGRFRIKTDGWMMAWLPNISNEYTQSKVGAVRGEWDLAGDWVAGNQEAGMTQNALERGINSLRLEFSNGDSMSYSASNVGLYNYDITEATNYTLLSAGGNAGMPYEGTESDYYNEIPYRYLYTDTTTRHKMDAFGAYTSSRNASRLGVEGTYFADTGAVLSSGGFQEDDTPVTGAIDIINRGLSPDSNTEYTLLAEIGQSNAYETGVTSGDHCANVLLAWS